jgi:hypothetical protein
MQLQLIKGSHNILGEKHTKKNEVKAYQKSPTLIPINLSLRAASLLACCLKTVTWKQKMTLSLKYLPHGLKKQGKLANAPAK